MVCMPVLKEEKKKVGVGGWGHWREDNPKLSNPKLNLDLEDLGREVSK